MAELHVRVEALSTYEKMTNTLSCKIDTSFVSRDDLHESQDLVTQLEQKLATINAVKEADSVKISFYK